MKRTILPIHSHTGLQALGWRNARRGETGRQPIWPIAGASEDDGADADAGEGDDKPDVDPDDEQDDAEENPEGAEQLGDAGKKALDAMKAKWREERTKRRAAEAKAAEMTKPEPKAAKSDEDGKTDPDPDAIRREVEAEVEAKVKAALEKEQARERVLDKIEVKATKSFADPGDAVVMLLREHKVEDFLDDDGKPDLEAIQDALNGLLEKKPYLAAAAQGGTKRFQGNGDGGAKPPKPQRPKSLDEAVKARLSR